MQNGPTLGIFKHGQCLVWFKDNLRNTIQVTESHNVRNALIIVQYTFFSKPTTSMYQTNDTTVPSTYLPI